MVWNGRSTRCLCAVLLCAIAAWPTGARAQARPADALTGTVLDPESKAVLNAAVIVRHQSTGEVRTATTDASGRFSVAVLPPGVYTVEVLVPGFEPVIRTGVEVGENAPANVSIRLTVA